MHCHENTLKPLRSNKEEHNKNVMYLYESKTISNRCI